MKKRRWALEATRGVALPLVIVVAIVLTMLVVALLSRQRSQSLATQSYFQSIVDDSFEESADAWIEAHLLRDLSLGTDADEQQEFIYEFPEDEQRRASYTFVANIEPSAPGATHGSGGDLDEDTVEIQASESYNNFLHESGVKIVIDGERSFRLPPRSALITSNLRYSSGRTDRISRILKLSSTTIEGASDTLGMYAKNPVELEGETAFVTNGDPLAGGEKAVWVMASQNSPLNWSSAGSHGSTSSFQVDGQLIVRPSSSGSSQIPASLGSLPTLGKDNSDHILSSQSSYKSYSSNRYQSIDVAGEVAQKVSELSSHNSDIRAYQQGETTLQASDGLEVVYNGDLTIPGDLKLEEGVKLFVKGKLTIEGSLTGKGAVYAEKDVEIEGTTKLVAGDERIALMSGGDVKLVGNSMTGLSSDLQTKIADLATHQNKSLKSLRKLKRGLEGIGPAGAGVTDGEKVEKMRNVFKEHLGMSSSGGGASSTTKVSGSGTTTNPDSSSTPSNIADLEAGVVIEHGQPVSNPSSAQLRPTSLSRLKEIADSLPSHSTTEEFPLLRDHVERAFDMYEDVGDGLAGWAGGSPYARYLDGDGKIQKDSTDYATKIEERFARISGIGSQEWDAGHIGRFFATAKFDDGGGGVGGYDAHNHGFCHVLSDALNDSTRLKDIWSGGGFASLYGNSPKKKARRYDLALLVIGLESLDAQNPYIFDALADELFRYKYGGEGDRKYLERLFKVYGKERFIALLDTLIVRMESVRFDFPGRSSFHGMVYAKGRVISEQPFYIDGVILSGGSLPSKFSHGTLFSVTPDTVAQTGATELFSVGTDAYIKGGL